MRIQLATVLSLSLAAATAHAERPAQVDSSRADAVELGYQLSRGDSNNHVLTGRFSSEGLEGPNTSQLSVQITMPVTYEVQSVDAAGVALVATSLRSPEISLSINGEPQASGPLANSLRSARLTQNVARDGTVVERTGSLSAVSAADAYVTGFISDTLATHWAQFPQEAVSIGDSWLQVLPMDMHDTENNLSATISVRYTLAGFAQTPAGEVAVIDAIYSTAVDGQMVGDSGRSVRVVGRGHGEGYLLFDHGSGNVYELGLENGVVLTATENNGQRTVTAFSSNVEFRAQVVAAVPQIAGQ